MYGEPPRAVVELLLSDSGSALLDAKAAGTPYRRDSEGRVVVQLERGGGATTLPELFSTDKNETFKCGGKKYAAFRLLAVAVRRGGRGDGGGTAARLEHVAPALSSAFCVKTQRAINDYRKAEYPHCSEAVTRLQYVGKETAEKLAKLQKHVPGLPASLAVVATAGELRVLLDFAEQQREVEKKVRGAGGMSGVRAPSCSRRGADDAGGGGVTRHRHVRRPASSGLASGRGEGWRREWGAGAARGVAFAASIESRGGGRGGQLQSGGGSNVGSLVTLVHWSHWFTGHSGSLFTLVHWSHWFTGHNGASLCP
eukprot:355022-Chlamydomonas_euryale.AAC.1